MTGSRRSTISPIPDASPACRARRSTPALPRRCSASASAPSRTPGCARSRRACGSTIPERLAGVPGVVRVQALGGERYRVDCQRDLRADIARRLAPEVELIGIHFAAPSLTEVYNRYFEEARLAAQ